MNHLLDRFEQGNIYEQFYTLSRLKDFIQVQYFENPLCYQKELAKDSITKMFIELSELGKNLRGFDNGLKFVKESLESIGIGEEFGLSEIYDNPYTQQPESSWLPPEECNYYGIIEEISELLRIFTPTEKLAFTEYCKFFKDQNSNPPEIRKIDQYFDYPLNQIRNSIEEPKQQKSNPLKLKKPNVFYYRIIKALIETGCFEDTTKEKIVNQFCSIVSGSGTPLTYESYRSQTSKENERDILEIINSLCRTLHKFGENYKIENGEIIKKTL